MMPLNFSYCQSSFSLGNVISKQILNYEIKKKLFIGSTEVVNGNLFSSKMLPTIQI